jgi:fumarate hydratase, class II
MKATSFRSEHDSMGELLVPSEALWGAQTQRAVDNFPISGWVMPRAFVRALALIKQAAATANLRVGWLDETKAAAIIQAATEIASGEFAAQFPVDVFQTGSGTSSNMNVNEVIVQLAARAGIRLHANDHVNLGQSSNDCVPAAIHVAAMLLLREQLFPALAHLAAVIGSREQELRTVVKTGRTHLMDAMPLTLAQELSGWRTQMEQGAARLHDTEARLLYLAIGGTAVGTGVNAHPDFASHVCRELQSLTGIAFNPSHNYFESLAAQDVAVELSGQLKVLAVGLMKIANDLRWMNSGPLAGIGEITLPALQPGSSIMPGKVNPVIPEAVSMVAAQVIGHDATITIAGQSGNFQLNVMLPVIAYNLLESLRLLGNALRLLADRAIAGFVVNHARLEQALQRNPVLVTALNSLIGYEQGALIAKRAYAEGRPILEVAVQMTGLPLAQLRELLDPVTLTHAAEAANKGSRV